MKLLTLIISAVVVAGCTSAPPTIQEGPNAEVSFDGLHMIDNARFAQAWAAPDIDFSRYTKVMGGGAFFEFRAVRDTSGATTQRRNLGNEFYIQDNDRQRLEEETTRIFDEELANSTRFEVTEEKGEDVLMLRGGFARHRVQRTTGYDRSRRNLAEFRRRSHAGDRSRRLDVG